METFWISFRISEKTASGKTYEDRYKALEETVSGMMSEYWKDTTSFIIFKSSSTIDTIAAECKKAIAPSVDLFLIRMLDTKSARICGKIEDNDILELMDYVKKI